ncbi:MAG: DUF4124 domain-containing protein, partial [Halothiobacillaceae bacterium]
MHGEIRMTPARHLAVLALLLLVGGLPTQGMGSEIYRCTGPDGGTIFSDAPCGADAEPMQVEAPPRGVGAGPGLAGTAAMAERYWARRAEGRAQRLEAARREREDLKARLREAESMMRQRPEVVVIQERVNRWPYPPNPYWHPYPVRPKPFHDRCGGSSGCRPGRLESTAPADPTRRMFFDSAGSGVSSPSRGVGVLPSGPVRAP